MLEDDDDDDVGSAAVVIAVGLGVVKNFGMVLMLLSDRYLASVLF